MLRRVTTDEYRPDDLFVVSFLRAFTTLDTIDQVFSSFFFLYGRYLVYVSCLLPLSDLLLTKKPWLAVLQGRDYQWKFFIQLERDFCYRMTQTIWNEHLFMVRPSELMFILFTSGLSKSANTYIIKYVRV